MNHERHFKLLQERADMLKRYEEMQERIAKQREIMQQAEKALENLQEQSDRYKRDFDILNERAAPFMRSMRLSDSPAAPKPSFGDMQLSMPRHVPQIQAPSAPMKPFQVPALQESAPTKEIQWQAMVPPRGNVLRVTLHGGNEIDLMAENFKTYMFVLIAGAGRAGIHCTDLTQSLNALRPGFSQAARSNAKKVLEKHGLITTMGQRRNMRYYPSKNIASVMVVE